MMKKVLMIAMVAAAVAACDEHVNHVRPEDAAKAWLQATNTPYEGSPTCTGGDSDRDGYVSCLARHKPEDRAQGEFIELQCAVNGAGDWDHGPFTSGCKMTQVWKRGQ